MTTQSPHPQRCETCKKTIHECPICVIGAYEIAQLHNTTSIIGCASHSSIPPATKPGHCGYERVVCRVFNPITDDECCQATQCRSDTRKQPSAEQRIEKVIEELNSERNKCDIDIPYERGVSYGYAKAIALLRGERG